MLTHLALVLHACLSGQTSVAPPPPLTPVDALFPTVAQVEWLEFDVMKERLRELFRVGSEGPILPPEKIRCHHVLGSQHVFKLLERPLNLLLRFYRRTSRAPSVEITFLDAAEKIAEYYLGSRPVDPTPATSEPDTVKP